MLTQNLPFASAKFVPKWARISALPGSLCQIERGKGGYKLVSGAPDKVQPV